MMEFQFQFSPPDPEGDDDMTFPHFDSPWSFNELLETVSPPQTKVDERVGFVCDT